ncbi:MAG: sigma-70 family RNA polymerase sigma factor [Saprospiraceae bacterium]|jgi:RNA polymerase sigma factor (sigma-70 family)|nr:sigma-70 family RNA polymerase sigma factor [Saprospiraceae bacterium]
MYIFATQPFKNTTGLANIDWTDERLLDGIKSRDDKAIRHLYSNHLSSLHRFIIRNGGTYDLANDIQQDVIIHIYEKVTKGDFILQEGTKLSTYLFTVGKFMFYKWLKKPIPPDEEIDEDFVEEEDEKENESDISDERVANALDAMDPDCKTILYRFYYDRKSMREIAEEIKTISEENLRKRKFKCMQKLKKVLLFKQQPYG